MAGISDKAIGKVENKFKYNGKELQHQEFSDGSGLEEYDFKYRYYDLQLGVFHNQDRLADKFAYMSPYQFCSDNPIWLREIDGLEGVKYTETDDNGNKTTVIEKNVVVLTKKLKEISPTASQKKFDRITRQNQRIEQRNSDKIASVKSELNTFYNGSDGKGAESTSGENVRFKFNVKGVEDFDKKNLKTAEIDAKYTQIGFNNGISALSSFGTKVIAPAAVITNESSGGDLGLTTGPLIVKANSNGPSGTFAHEILHTLGLPDNGYDKGGILNSPPQPIISPEVDEVLKDSYDKN